MQQAKNQEIENKEAFTRKRHCSNLEKKSDKRHEKIKSRSQKQKKTKRMGVS